MVRRRLTSSTTQSDVDQLGSDSSSDVPVIVNEKLSNSAKKGAVNTFSSPATSHSAASSPSTATPPQIFGRVALADSSRHNLAPVSGGSLPQLLSGTELSASLVSKAPKMPSSDAPSEDFSPEALVASARSLDTKNPLGSMGTKTPSSERFFHSVSDEDIEKLLGRTVRHLPRLCIHDLFHETDRLGTSARDQLLKSATRETLTRLRSVAKLAFPRAPSSPFWRRILGGSEPPGSSSGISTASVVPAPRPGGTGRQPDTSSNAGYSPKISSSRTASSPLTPASASPQGLEMSSLHASGTSPQSYSTISSLNPSTVSPFAFPSMASHTMPGSLYPFSMSPTSAGYRPAPSSVSDLPSDSPLILSNYMATPASSMNSHVGGSSSASSGAPDFSPPSSWEYGASASLLRDMTSGIIEEDPNAIRTLLEASPNTVADMANLKPCPEAMLIDLKAAGLRTELKAHQSTGLRFLIESEHRKLPLTHTDEEVCLWKVLEMSRTGNRIYVNVASQEPTVAAPSLPRGAILADAMGLGKTLMILALIIADPNGKGIIENNVVPSESNAMLASGGGAATKRSTSKPTVTSKQGSQQILAGPSQPEPKKRKASRVNQIHNKKAKRVIVIDSDSDIDAKIWSSSDSSDESDTASTSKRTTQSKRTPLNILSDAPSRVGLRQPTLIVCPLSVLSNWVDQAKQHTNLRFGVLYGEAGEDLKAESDWSKYDFIVTTYDVIKLAYREIALFKYHKLREGLHISERNVILRDIQRANTMARGHPEIRDKYHKALADHDELWKRIQVVTPTKLGKTDWKKAAICQERCRMAGKSGLANLHSPKSSRKARSGLDSSSSPTATSSDAEAGEGAKQNLEKAASLQFEKLSKQERLYVWSGIRLKPNSLRVFEQQWLRVVLDEAHVARNRNTHIFGAVKALKAERRMAVTGTPLINSTHDIGSLASFIGVEPFRDDLGMWKWSIDTPIKSNQPRGMRLLRSICKSLIILRTKEMKIDGRPLVELPPVQNLKYQLQLNPQDMDFYRRAEEALRKKIKHWIDEEVVAEHSASILMFLTRMRQLACDKRLVPSTLVEDIESLDLDDSERRKLPAALRETLEQKSSTAKIVPSATEP